jgi:hypothetical protein
MGAGFTGRGRRGQKACNPGISGALILARLSRTDARKSHVLGDFLNRAWKFSRFMWSVNRHQIRSGRWCERSIPGGALSPTRYCHSGARHLWILSLVTIPGPMPNTNQPLPIRCPNCEHEGCTLVVKSLTVMTVKCANCRHFWATDLESLPSEVHERIPDALSE